MILYIYQNIVSKSCQERGKGIGVAGIPPSDPRKELVWLAFLPRIQESLI